MYILHMSLINPNKKYKKLITSGCSFTHGHFQGEEASWGYQLSELLGCEHINRGAGGSSNYIILNKIIKYCETNDMTDCCVGLQFSEISRREYWLNDYKRYQTVNYASLDDEHFNHDHKTDQMYFIKENKDFFQSIWWEDNENVIRAINFMLMAKSYLISKNIDFIIFEGIGSILDYDFDTTSNFPEDMNDMVLLSREYREDFLSDKHFFTKYKTMMPFMFTHPLFNNDNGRHPNLEFVKWWSQEMYNYLKENN